jgi:predicted secreted protein
VILSDGSSYKQLTTSPRGVIRNTKDARNNPLWNPSMRELADVEEDEAGRLAKFRERFGMGFEEDGGLLEMATGGEKEKKEGEKEKKEGEKEKKEGEKEKKEKK